MARDLYGTGRMLVGSPGGTRAQSVTHRMRSCAALAAVSTAACGAGAGEPEPLFDPEVVERDFVRVVTCAPSSAHAFQASSATAAARHDARHISTLADPEAAELFERCVLSESEGCDEVRFPAGAKLVTYHYDGELCAPGEIAAYTAAERLEGEHPPGEGWRWQWVSADLQILEDGTPPFCTGCHIDRCSSPDGFDLRCGH